MFGCGYSEEYTGKATAMHSSDDSPLAELKTCPQWLYLEDHTVQFVLDHLEEYKRGQLGTIWAMDADMVDYFRVAENEYSNWRSIMEDQIYGS